MALTYESLAVAPRTQEVTNYKLNEQMSKASEQATVSIAQNNQNEMKMQRPEKMTDSSETPFKFDAKEKGNNEYYRQESERKKKEEERNSEHKKLLGCTFDITV